MDIITETVLEQYFLFRAVLGRCVDDRRLLETVSGKLLSDREQTQAIYALTQNETVKEVVTLNEAMRFSRIRQYNEMYGKNIFSDEVCQAVALKSNALSVAESNDLLCNCNATPSMVYNTLRARANVGNVTAMRILGVILCEGMIAERNFTEGLRLLGRTSEWADFIGTLMLMGYADTDELRRESLSRLRACVDGSEYESLCRKACAVYNVGTVRPSEEVLLLKKAFFSMRFKTNVYDAQCARLLFGKALNIKDKEKVLFSENKNLLSEVCSLPLKLRCGGICADKYESAVPLRREKEQSRVFAALRNADLRQNDSYRPICLVSRSDYVLDAYADLLCGLNSEDAKSERIDIADLKQFDFEPTSNNVFVRSASDGKNNVYVLVLLGQTEDYAIDAVKNFLDTVKRRRFHLANPLVTLNLDPILPICICDEANADKIKDVVDVVKLANATSHEKRNLVARMVSDKSMYYLHRTVEAEDKALDELCAHSRDEAEYVLDRVFGDNRFSDGFDCVTAEIVRNYLSLSENKSDRPYGFGGYHNEIH